MGERWVVGGVGGNKRSGESVARSERRDQISVPSRLESERRRAPLDCERGVRAANATATMAVGG